MRFPLIAALLALATVASAQTTTPRQRLNYVGNEQENRNWSKVDSQLPYGTTTSSLLFCGQQVDDSGGATPDFLGPAVSAFFGRTNPLMGDATCDALDSTTEATAAKVVNATFPAFRVVGMRCSVSSDPTNDVILTARTASGDLSPTLTCTVAGTGSGQDCFATIGGAAPVVAAGATVDVKVVNSENLSAQDASCVWTIQY